MRKKIILVIIALIIVAASVVIALVLARPDAPTPDSEPTPPTINGVSLSEYVIVYDEDALDYNKRAAEYIKNTAAEKYGIELTLVDDDTDKNPHEIVVGETSREISASLNEKTEGLEFSILADVDSIALEGDYFVIAAAAYYFTETYASRDGESVNIPTTPSVHEPIVKKAKNFILLIGDGMGVYQTKLFEYMENTCDYGDGEDLFYGYMLPYLGYSRTESLSGITDSAAGGTALACGHKTYNEYIGRDKDLNDIKSLTELADELGKSAAVMSTETQTGATPSSFAAHASDRDSTLDLMDSLINATQQYGTIVDCGYDYYTASRISTIEKHIQDNLNTVAENDNGFFFMYEEAYIDKHCHNNNMNKAFETVIRFNQAIARFMEFAFYNPETMVIITADHETGELYPDEDGTLNYHHDDHSAADVLIFAYGYDAHLFNGVTVENIQIAHTIAALMGDENFGDQSVYQSLTKGK